jgi:hypothetical protein
MKRGLKHFRWSGRAIGRSNDRSIGGTSDLLANPQQKTTHHESIDNYDCPNV